MKKHYIDKAYEWAVKQTYDTLADEWINSIFILPFTFLIYKYINNMCQSDFKSLNKFFKIFLNFPIFI